MPYTVCPHQPSTVPVPSYYTGKYFCGPIPFYYRDSGTSNVVPAIYRQISSGPVSSSVSVPIIYHLISSGTVPFFYRDTSTRSIASGLVPFSYSDTGTRNFTDKYLLAQYHFIASTPVYIWQSHKIESNNVATSAKLLCVFRHLVWCIWKILGNVQFCFES